MFQQKEKLSFTRKPRQHNANKPKGQQQQRRLDAHEHKLIEAKRAQKEMRFNTLDGRITGKVVNFDKYSIVIEEKNTGEEICLFKHAVNSFAPSEYAR